MNSIEIVIYSYKSKRIVDLLSSIFNNQSGSNQIKVNVFDQYPFDRQRSMSNLFDITYKNISWDSITTPCEFKDEILGQSKSDYVLILSDCITLNKNWDKELISLAGDDNKIISGNEDISIYIDKLFYIKKTLFPSLISKKTNFIDRNLIFGKAKILQGVKYPVYVKYFGEEEALSVEYFTRGYDIYSCPTNIYSVDAENSIEKLYCPFSNKHGYNDVIELLKTGGNKFTSLENRNRSIKDFEIFHGIDFKNINKLPYVTDDVKYDPMQLKFNAVDARRFIKNPGSID
jgi:hypothetical protein